MRRAHGSELVFAGPGDNCRYQVRRDRCDDASRTLPIVREELCAVLEFHYQGRLYPADMGRGEWVT